MAVDKLHVVLSAEDVRKYPFLPEALERVRYLGLTIEDIAAPLLRSVVERAAKYLEAAIDSLELPPPSEDCDEEALAYLVSLLILKIISDKMLIRRFSVAFSKRVFRLLLSEDNSKVAYVLSQLGLRVKLLGAAPSGYTFAINVFDYIENIPERRGQWKLAHRLVEAGWVLASKVEAVRLGEEALKKAVEERVEGLRVDGVRIPDAIYSLAEVISRKWSIKLREIREAWASEAPRGGEFPPCIRAIIDDLKAGKNIPHSARFALAAFLLNVGMSVDEVLEVFKSAPDFNERVARYQVEHIAGMRGSGKRYSPYKCDNMRTLGLCVAECGVKHPLQYYWRSARRGAQGGQAAQQ